MAAACGCHSVLSGNMLPRFHVSVVSETMCRRLCGCRMEGEEWRELRERSGQESRWASRRGGHCPPNPAPLLSGTLSLCSVVVDASSTQQGSGCRTATSESGGEMSAVAFRGGTPCGTAACPKPHRGVRARHRALAAECLRHGGHCG
ncbi:hypothetical protein TcCL_ESM09358 [Trypanosoma cruzi]|nr:hypothetical protein TcCL_ESM09358 [Trypanosoma cruzi]